MTCYTYQYALMGPGLHALEHLEVAVIDGQHRQQFACVRIVEQVKSCGY